MALDLRFCEDHEPVWPLVSGWLKSACDRFDIWTIEDARFELDIGNAALWILHDDNKPCAALVTQVDTNTNTGIIALVGGRNVLRGASQNLWMIEDWARQNGARFMAMNGRPGWVRFLKSHGYRAVGTTVIRDL